MEVRKGYKQTEVGVIPEDWDVKSLNKLADVRDGTHESPKFYKSGVPFVTSKNIVNGKLDFSEISYITKEDAISFNVRSKVDKGDILMSMIGTVGNAVLIDFEPDFCIKNVSLLKPRAIYAQYLIQLMRSPQFQKYLDDNMAGGIQKFVALGKLRKLEIPVPTHAEQEAIAETLSDADALIESLETLLAKKRQVKQGAMSELLTGKRRVVESGKWKVKKLGELLDFERPDKYIVESTEYLENGSVPVLTANKSFVLGYTDEEFGIYENLPVIIFDDFTTDKKYVDFPFKVKSSAIKILKPKSNKVNLRFIFERMQLIRFSLGDHKRYYISEYQHIQIEMPSLAEQTAIAEILSDMDAEIRAVEEKLSKARAVKAGMMSELLSGKIRLVKS